MTNSTTVIAEAGVNHNGQLDLAIELVDCAAESGANFIKFQTYRAEALASKRAKKAAYQKRSTNPNDSQLQMLQRLELSFDDHKVISRHCTDKGIQFLSSPFDISSLEFLTKTLGLKSIKLGSGELTNAPLLYAAAKTGVDIILSTGMSSIAEIEEALGVFAYGICKKHPPSSRRDFSEILLDSSVWPALAERITLLHCTTEYPAAVEEANLRAMNTLRKAFGVKVGYSDHTLGTSVSLAAVALGACVIEKHFTLDRNLPGPDHAASLEPSELTSFVTAIRDVERSLGSGIKQPSTNESLNRSIVRKSILAGTDILAGKILTHDNMTIKRPGCGISPMEYWDLLGAVTSCDLKQDDPIDWKYIKIGKLKY